VEQQSSDQLWSAQPSSKQQAALAEAEGWVRRFVRARGGFALFALAIYKDGKIVPIQPTAEFDNVASAMAEMLGILITLADEGQIDACVVCTPVKEGEQRMAMFDVEVRTDGRLLALLPYKKRWLGWSFGAKARKRDVPKIFSSPQQV
jgi:hypothetical protein